MVEGCFVCERIALIHQGANPTFIAELPGGYAVMGDEQFPLGYCLLLAKVHVRELHELPEREQFLHDMVRLGQAVWRVARPAKLNYGMLGNEVEHLHCHVRSRYADEPDENRRGPVSTYPPGVRFAPEHRFDPARHGAMLEAIRRELAAPDRG